MQCYSNAAGPSMGSGGGGRGKKKGSYIHAGTHTLRRHILHMICHAFWGVGGASVMYVIYIHIYGY